MSSAVLRNVGLRILSPISEDGGRSLQAEAAKASSPDDGPANSKIEARTDDFKAREQVVGQRVAAAGATRSDNDADLLGYVRPKSPAASRSILGQ